MNIRSGDEGENWKCQYEGSDVISRSKISCLAISYDRDEENIKTDAPWRVVA